MSNGFEEFAKAAHKLAKVLDDKQENLADIIIGGVQEKQIQAGEKTREDAFAENVEFSKGEMLSLFCSVCGNKIFLHEKITEGYCEYCGEKIALKPALRGEISKTAIENISGKDLYKLGTQSDTPKLELVEAAAKKDYIEAIRMMAYHYLDEDDKKAFEFASVGAKKGDVDCQCYLIAAKGKLGKVTDLSGAINLLDQYMKKGFATNEAKHVCQTVRKIIQDVYDKAEMERREQEIRDREAMIEARLRMLREEEARRREEESKLPDFVVVPRIDVSDM